MLVNSMRGGPSWNKNKAEHAATRHDRDRVGLSVSRLT